MSGGIEKGTDIKEKQSIRKKKQAPFIICVILSVISAAGIISGFVLGNAAYMIAGLLPVAVYELMRTEGLINKFASISIIVLLILEAAAVIWNIKFNLADFLRSDSEYVQGYSIPLGDIKMVFPAILIVLSVVLVINTAGPYTKWLSVLIIISSLCIIYVISPKEFPGILRWAVRQVISVLSYIFSQSGAGVN